MFGINVAPPLFSKKMYTDDEKAKLFQMKDAGATWKFIGLALNKNPKAVRQWFRRNMINRALPPKVKVSKKMTDGRIGLLIKKIARDNPNCRLGTILLP